MILRIMPTDVTSHSDLSPADALRDTLHREVILTRILLTDGGRCVLDTREWEEYWAPVRALASPAVDERLAALRDAWTYYIDARFAPAAAEDYCRRYAALIEALSGAPAGALNCARAFECFSIVPFDAPGQLLAAATSTLRNPNVLIARRSANGAGAELPGAAPGCRFGEPSGHVLPIAEGHAVLLYPAATAQARAACDRLVRACSQRPTHRLQLRARARSRELAEDVVLPWIEHHIAPGAAEVELEIVDVSVGRGNLVARLCQQIEELTSAKGVHVRFRLWMLDPAGIEEGRLAPKQDLRQLADMLYVFKVDYELCVGRADRLPAATGLRLALVTSLSERVLAPMPLAAPTARVAQAAGESVPWSPERPRLTPVRGHADPLQLDVARSTAPRPLGPARPAGRGCGPRLLRLPPQVEERPSLRCAGQYLGALARACGLVVVQAPDFGPTELSEVREHIDDSSVAAVELAGAAEDRSFVFVSEDDETLKSLAGRRIW